jgi:pentatricopeptide repeat protein
MYAKCGAVDQAAAVFDGMARRDVYTYASMIAGLATHGRAEEALALFSALRRAGVRPNGVALLGVLSACCHAGLVDEGLRHLGGMEEAYGVAPGVEHYGCAIDMLGRAGRLDEAAALVAAMPMPPDALVRGSLLAACRACGDVERAERVMRWMLAVDRSGGEAGDHVLMSNMYASKGRHGRALQLRKQMRRSKIVKDPGCSSIEIDGVVHEFQAVPANAIA